MMKYSSLIGFMIVLGAMPLAMVSADDPNGCGFPDDIHYYFPSGSTIVWSSKKDDRALFGVGPASLEDTCVPDVVGGEPIDASDYDYDWGFGGTNLPAFTVPACRPVIGHHNLEFYVNDWVFGRDTVDAVSGFSGADGTLPCGDGLIVPNLQPEDCLEPFWGKGPHLACGVGADGSYWVFVNTLAVDLNEPRVGVSSGGCIWTTNFGGKDVKPCLKDGS